MTTPPDHIPPETPAFREDQLSQIPALHLLQNLGYRYLLPAEALRLRGERESQVLLLDVLADQLRRINRVRHRGQEQPFTEGAIAEAVRQLRDLDDGAGLVQTNRAAWDLIRFGVTQPQTIYDPSDGCVSQDPSPGFDVTVTRVFKKDGAEVKRQTFKTTYIPEDDVICSAKPDAKTSAPPD